MIEHAQRAGNFVEQARNLFDRGVIPGRFDEGDDVLLGLDDVDRGFLHQRVENLAHFGLRQFHFDWRMSGCGSSAPRRSMWSSSEAST